VDACASGFAVTVDGAVCDGASGVVATLKFDHVSESVVSAEGYGVEASIHGPLTIYKRGVWFDGMDDYARLTNYRAHHTHTIQFWTMIYQDGALYSMRSSLLDFEFQLHANGHFLMLVFGGKQILVHMLHRHEWRLVTVTVAWNRAAKSKLTVFAEDARVAELMFDGVVVEDLAPAHYLGSVLADHRFFQGFIWQVRVYNEALPLLLNDVVIGTCGAAHCQFCPPD
jgi:hypothetical protein